MLLIPANAQAYVNHGRWIADCPTGCNSAMAVEPGQAAFLCGVPSGGRLIGGCGATADLEWPPDPDAVLSALLSRPAPNQNWAPAGHRQTFVSHTPDGRMSADAYPDGQTVTDLQEEAI